MIFSYLGLSEPVGYINGYLQNMIIKFRNADPELPPPMSSGGVYSGDIGQAISFASNNDMATFIKPYDLFEKSDIVFVFLSDKSLKSLASSLRGHGISNKIIVHCSQIYDASILDFGPSNTYVSIYIPFANTDDYDIKPFMFTEGYGNLFDDFIYVSRLMGFKPVVLNSDEKLMLAASFNFKKYMIEIIDEISDNLLVKALHSKSDIVKITNNNLQDDNIYSKNIFKNTDTSYIQNLISLIDDYDISDVKPFLGGILLHEIKDSLNTDKSINDCMNIAKKLLTDKKNFG